MKQTILTVILLLLTGSSFTYGKSAGSEPKIKMIFIAQEGCRSCKMIKKHLQHDPVKSMISDHFILVIKDLSESRSLPNNLEQPIGTPTIYFLDENSEELIDTMIGGKSEKNFTQTLQKAIEANQKKSK